MEPIDYGMNSDEGNQFAQSIVDHFTLDPVICQANADHFIKHTHSLSDAINYFCEGIAFCFLKYPEIEDTVVRNSIRNAIHSKLVAVFKENDINK